jgi:thymidine kinase
MPNGFLHEPEIEVIVGCMFSGKTEELARRVNLLKFAQVKGQTFCPARDTRSERSVLALFPNTIVFHESRELLRFAETHPDVPVLAVDEVQFCDNDFPKVVDQLARRFKRRVIVSGLNLDFLGRPFGPTPVLMAMATKGPTLLRAICQRCGSGNGLRSQRIIPSTETILVGDTDKYEARCIDCFNPDTRQT